MIAVKDLKSVAPAISRRDYILNDLNPLKPVLGIGFTELDMRVSSTYLFKQEELCATHQLSYIKLVKQYRDLDNRAKAFYGKVESIETALKANLDLSGLDDFQISKYRIRDSIYTEEMYLNNIKSLVDQHFIVGLWVLTEQTIAKVLEVFYDLSGLSSKIPFRWDETLKLFQSLSLNTDENLEIYKNINELRVLNNKIKHLNKVDAKLSEFDYFKNMLNEPIDKISLELQRYSDYSCAFIYFIVEQLEVVILNGTPLKNDNSHR
ncbi:hypothetical protein [Psychrobacter sp. ANT_WB68]|uniref:hypothetical protein n=1 Tax=Psychrobacter sp. ANT_WB68 TaxID=2597355 RepID=UPI0011F0C715|nr:hypothetical protein [Psychrobacter sp. ANT_WB68]KAA0915422.1 hypothetical protein FQ084_02410 [Psychrobacter sp. ANT_WB68]